MRKSKQMITAFVLAVLAVILCCSCGEDSSSYYSSSYNKDSKYRNNVDSIAGSFGESPHKVDSIINSMADAINK